MTDRWMHPAIWWLLFFVAPPVWLFLIVLRYLDFFVIVAAVVFLAMMIRPDYTPHASAEGGSKLSYERLQ